MAEKTYIEATVKNETGARLSKGAVSLQAGKWQTDPDSIDAGAEGTFKASGKADTATGTEGSVQYHTGDGTVFEIQWDVPYTGDNDTQIECLSGLCALYNYPAPEFSRSGNISPTFTITKR